MSSLLSKPVRDSIHNNPIKPCGEVRVATETSELIGQNSTYILRQIIRISSTAQHSKRQPMYRIIVTREQRRKGVSVAPIGGLNQIMITRFHSHSVC
jgi:hypothetical protein